MSNTCLLELPLEIRSQIYNYVFHSSQSLTHCRSRAIDKECLNARLSSETDCGCGAGLSTANRQLYYETRTLFYSCAYFKLVNPIACLRFLECIGLHAMDIEKLSITHEYQSYDVTFLEKALRPFTSSQNLRFLRARISAVGRFSKV